MVAGGGAIALRSLSSAEEEEEAEGLLPRYITAPSTRPFTIRLALILLPFLGLGLVLLALSSLFASPPALFATTDSNKPLIEQEREQGVPQRVVEWSAEDHELRSYRWEAPPVHSSLQHHLNNLTAVRRPPLCPSFARSS